MSDPARHSQARQTPARPQTEVNVPKQSRFMDTGAVRHENSILPAVI